MCANKSGSSPGAHLDVKGDSADAKGYRVDVKGYMVDVKDYRVDSKGYLDVLEAGGHVLGAGRVLDGGHEEVGEPRQRVLVHGLDDAEVADAEEEHRGEIAAGGVALPGQVNILLRLVRQHLQL